MKHLIYVLIILLVYCSSVMGSDYMERVNERESEYSFQVPSNQNIGAISRIKTLIAMIKNFEIIQDVHNGTIQHKKLKKILNEFDRAIKEKGRSKELFIYLYEFTTNEFPPNRSTDGAGTILTFLDYGGDCNDVSASLYSLFNYYKFETIVIIGNAVEENGEDELHAWLGVIFDENLVELDALWYGRYVELNRIKKMDKWWSQFCSVKDKYVKQSIF